MGIRLAIGALLLAIAAPIAEAKPPRPPSPPPASLDLSLLEAASPKTTAEMHAMSPGGLASISRAWWIAGRPDRATPMLDYLESLGTDAYGIGQAWVPFQPVNKREYPANAIYTTVLVALGKTFFVTGRQAALQRIKGVLRKRISFYRGCFAYDDQLPKIGCVHNVNSSVLGLLSWLDGRYREKMKDEFNAALEYEWRTVRQDGWWRYWEQAPTPTMNDYAHQAYTATHLLAATDRRLRRLGQKALAPIRRSWTPDAAVLAAGEQARAYAPVEALVMGGDLSACGYVPEIPKWEYEWAEPDYGTDPSAAIVHIRLQLLCSGGGA